MTSGTVVSYPGVMMPAKQVALAFHEAADLKTYATTLAVHSSDRALQWLPSSLRRELNRRDVTELPSAHLARYPTLESLRTIASRCGASAPWVDRLWDHGSRQFDRSVAKLLAGAHRVYAYEYTAFATFHRARQLGVHAVLDLPSLDSRELDMQLRAEYERHPSLAAVDKPYFDAKFAERYERRRGEIAMADVLIANSNLTAQSHIAAGADARRMRVVSLAGPPPRDRIEYSGTAAPLKVILASGLGVRKGPHYFLDAWKLLAAGPHARALVYGQAFVPPWLAARSPVNVELRGAVSQAELFEAIAACDVLVFPTLSDGFGLVVTEALAQGVPVITTTRAGAADRIEHGRNGFVIPAADAVALRDALQWCLDNRHALSGMREHAHRAAAQWQWSDYRAAIRKAVVTS
jgi:glycosyltransferase involved in cell wall biosynthesis